jgi:flagellar hook-length control protein FliK
LVPAPQGCYQRTAAATLPAAAEQAAKFAVADPPAPLAENLPSSKPEPGASTSTLSTLAAPLAPPANDSAEPPRGIQTPLRDPSWASDLGQKLLWFVGNDKQLAQLTVHPPQLGSIEITLNLDKDHANAHFASPSAEVRGAIEAAVPRLREMFASAGIALGQVSVGSESFRPPPDGQREPSRPPLRPADNAILGSDSASRLTSTLLVTQRGRGMIDTFA